MQKCIQCGYERQEKDDIIDPGTCPKCGIIYAKWRPDFTEHKPSGINKPAGFQKPRPTNAGVSDQKSSAKYAVIAGALLLLVVILIFFSIGRKLLAIPVLNESASFEYRLEKAADDLNARCPITVNSDGRLDAVYYEPEKNKVTFDMTLTRIAYKDLPGYGKDDVLDKAKTYLINFIKQDERLYSLYSKINTTCVIKTNDAVEYGRIRISPSDY